MAKSKTARKLDTMSITVLLVMSIFGGIVGYFIGQSQAAAQATLAREAAVILKDKGMMMETAGKMMEQRGTRYGDRELSTQGASLSQEGSMMQTKAGGMMNGY